MRKASKITALLLVLCMCAWTLAGCGDSSKPSDAESYTNDTVTSELSMAEAVKAYYDKIDLEYGYDLTEELAYNWDDLSEDLGWRTAGSDSEHATADFLVKEFKEIGLKDVEKLGTKCDRFQFNSSSLKIADSDVDFHGGDQDAVEAGTNGPAAYQINGTNGDFTAEIVDCNEGAEWDYDGLDVKGKIALVKVDQWNNSWIDGYVTQAEEMGAAAIVTWADSGYGEAGTNTTNVQDACLPGDSIPTCAISADQAAKVKEAIKAGHTQCTLNIDAEYSDDDGTTYNVVGKIPGKNHDQRILIAGHYDKYWYGFQDDCAAIGLVATIAKAMIESGYEPENDIYFVAHGAEEWGSGDSMFDWTTGAWGMVNEQKDFAEKTIALINCELPAFTLTNDMDICAVPEFFTLVKDMFDSGLIVTAGEKKLATKVETASTMEDGISYREYGVPYLLNGFEADTEFMQGKYHTKADNKDTYDPDTFQTNINWYGAYAMYIDSEPALPLDMTQTTNLLKEGFNEELAKEAGVDTEEYLAAVDSLAAAFQAQNDKIKACNDAYEQAMKDGDADAAAKAREEGQDINEDSLEAFQMIQDDFLKVNDMTCFYGHSQMYDNINLIDGVLGVLDSESPEIWAEDKESGAGDMAWQINAGLDANFGLFSIDLGNDGLSFYEDSYYKSKNQEQWGYKHLMPMLDTGDASYAVQMSETIDDIESVDEVKACYNDARISALKYIKEYATQEIKDMAEIADELD